MKVAVIGGSPAGLATLRFLAHAHEYFPIPPIQVRLFEAESQIGGTFSYRVYEDAELVSSKYLTAFSDFRLPDNAPDFVTPEVYVQYLKDYATNFTLWPMIERNTRVEKQGDFDWECDAVAVCSGINVNPFMPHIEGIERVPKVFHSSRLKSRDQFGENTNVYIMGAGETGMDLAYLAVTSDAKTVTLCHRDGFFCAPKIIPIPQALGRSTPTANKPVDTSVASLFDTAYAHPKLQKSQILWTYYDSWIKNMHKFISGTEEGPDQWVGQMSPDRKYMDSILLCKSDKALPYMSIGKRSQSWGNRIRSFFLNVKIENTKGKKIDVMTWPTSIDRDGNMQFDNKLPRDVTLGYIGFVRPSIGAIPPLAELQAQLWVLHLLQHQYPKEVPPIRDSNALESYDLDYRLHPRGNYSFYETKRAVDHESYAYQLALDIGSAPKARSVMKKGWKVFYTWAMGSNFNTKFRMVGPWKWEQGAENIMRNELYNIVKRSGGFVYLATYTLVPLFLFGSMSLVLYAWYAMCNYFASLFGGHSGSATNDRNAHDDRIA
ncbi:flavin-containing monooxygenase [Fusarium acutatum]|uniref:Flavin-containing monooxygenase n=1 Tax=Fusarium acutatum TaxID=78861 RepID=A0A8H4JDG9_9HYPO|nr:flavin-containing monooxygenase [Fusarium acutatum]